MADPQDITKLGQREVDVVAPHPAEAAQLVNKRELAAVGAVEDLGGDGSGGEPFHVVGGHRSDGVALGGADSIAVDGKPLFGVVGHYSLQVVPGAFKAFESLVAEDVGDGHVAPRVNGKPFLVGMVAKKPGKRLGYADVVLQLLHRRSVPTTVVGVGMVKRIAPSLMPPVQERRRGLDLWISTARALFALLPSTSPEPQMPLRR